MSNARKFARIGGLVLTVLVSMAGAARPTSASDYNSATTVGAGGASEAVVAATARPNLTPALFTVNPAGSAKVFAAARENAATKSSACGGANGGLAGRCCPAQASDGACDDRDPVSSQCADATSYTVTQANITDSSGDVIGLVEVRFSPTCNTNWGRITGYGPYVSALKQTTACRGTAGQYSDSGCTDTDTGTEATRFSDQLFAPSECVYVVGVLVDTGTSGAAGKFTASTPAAC